VNAINVLSSRHLKLEKLKKSKKHPNRRGEEMGEENSDVIVIVGLTTKNNLDSQLYPMRSNLSVKVKV